jgi:uncharacterized protein YbjT (DUF2867 family)
MWTNVNQVYCSRDGQNCCAHLAMDNAWHKVLTGAADGVTNVFCVLTTAKGNNRQIYAVLDASASKNIIQVYM